MNVGIVGLGKLGLPVAYAMAARGLNVYGYDPAVNGPPADTSHEAGLADTIALAGDRLRFCDLATVVRNADVVFCAVQTPHEARFEGVTPLTDDRADFDYTFLVQAARHVSEEALKQGRRITLAVISTVLPGTMRRYVQPGLGDHVTLVYNPSFIAMGTTIRDFLDPEFVLIGGDDRLDVQRVYEEVLGDLYLPDREAGQTPSPAVWSTSISNAELTKVAYNTFIGMKVAFANTIMEVCHKTGCDVDEVTGALKLARRRLISSAYLDGGMGDGGGCHPRDNIALSWLARELDLSHDLFDDVMRCREDQAEWLVELMREQAAERRLPTGILGIAYKAGSHLVTGSSALLVRHLLSLVPGDETLVYDPHVADDTSALDAPRVFLVGCKHPEFANLRLPAGSVVIDPFRYIPDQDGVEVIRIGWARDRTPTSAATSQQMAA